MITRSASCRLPDRKRTGVQAQGSRFGAFAGCAHAHFDHDAVYRPHAVMVLERLAGTYALGDISVNGLADKHVCKSPGWYRWELAAEEFDQDFCPPSNRLHMDNFIQLIETGGPPLFIGAIIAHNLRRSSSKLYRVSIS